MTAKAVAQVVPRPGSAGDPSAPTRITRRGYTLVECIVAMGVGAVILVVGLQLYIQTQRVMARQEVQAARLGTETDLLGLLRRDVRAAALVAPESTDTRLVLLGPDGSRVTYRPTLDGVVRVAAASPLPLAEQALSVKPRFDYPAPTGRRNVVRVFWGQGRAGRSVTLHLRNYGT